MGKIESKVDAIDKAVTAAFARIKQELDEHLDSINQNTQEITSCYQTIAELDSKIEKLSERIDEYAYPGAAASILSPVDIELTLREQEVFAALFAHPEGISITQCARMLGLTEDLIHTNLCFLLEKGVPIHKSVTEFGETHQLDRKFRQMQEEQEIVLIHPEIRAQFSK